MNKEIEDSERILKEVAEKPDLIKSSKADISGHNDLTSTELHSKSSAIVVSQLDQEAQNIIDLSAQSVECARSLIELLDQAQDEIMKEIRLTCISLAETNKLHDFSMTKESPYSAYYLGQVNEEKYCICRGGTVGDMVNCDNPSCPFQWFHILCVGLEKIPDNWFCPYCTALMRQSAESQTYKKHEDYL